MSNSQNETLNATGKAINSSADERKITLVAIAYFFFVICSYYVIKPIRGSLALELGPRNIPVLNILSMISLIVGNAVYSYIVGRYKRDIFIPFITRFFVVCLIGFWLLFSFAFPINDKPAALTTPLNAESTDVEIIAPAIQQSAPGATLHQPAEDSILKVILPVATLTDSISSLPAEIGSQAQLIEISQPEPEPEPEPEAQPHSSARNSPAWFIVIGGYYLWVNIFALLAVSMFWSFMNDVFTVDQSRRLYAIIGYGGLIGGLVGSVLTVYLVELIGTANMFILATVLLYPSIWCMQYIHNNHYRHEGIPEKPSEPVKPAHPPRPWDGLMSVYKNPILLLMAFEMFLYTFSSTMFFQQLNELLASAFDNDVNGRTAFVAGIYSRINIVSLFTQFFVTRLVMMLPNPIFGLLMLNVIQVAGTLIMLFSPSLSVVSWTLIIRYALNYSTGRAMRELIYIPLDREAKYQGKGFIDTVVFRLGDGLSSVMLIGGLGIFSYGPWIDHSILVAMAIQFYVIIRVASLYGSRLKESAGA